MRTARNRQLEVAQVSDLLTLQVSAFITAEEA